MPGRTAGGRIRALVSGDRSLTGFCSPARLDIDEIWARRARELGVLLVIDSDAHSAGTLSFMACGVDQARRGWIEPRDVLNTRGTAELEAWLRERSRALGPARRRAAPRRRQARAAAVV